MIVLLILASFIPNKPDITNGLICVALLVVGLLREVAKDKGAQVIKDVLVDIDYFTLALLGGLFIVIGGLTQVGVIDRISSFIANLGQGNVFVVYTVIVWLSVVVSGFVDNIPYVATMPSGTGVANLLGRAHLLTTLLIGATRRWELNAHRLPPIHGPWSLVRKGTVSREFMKLSVPFTLAAVTTGYVLVWLLWGLGA